MRFLPETANRKDWPRLVAQIVNRLVRSDARSANIATQSADYTAGDGDHVILADATAGAMTITLPAFETGREIIVKKVDSSSNNVTVSGDIDGSTSYDLTTQYESITLFGGPDQWWSV